MIGLQPVAHAPFPVLKSGVDGDTSVVHVPRALGLGRTAAAVRALCPADPLDSRFDLLRDPPGLFADFRQILLTIAGIFDVGQLLYLLKSRFNAVGGAAVITGSIFGPHRTVAAGIGLQDRPVPGYTRLSQRVPARPIVP